MVDLEWIMPVAPEVRVKKIKERKIREKVRKPQTQRTNQRAMNPKRMK